jgi:hypothetical protein
VHLDSAEETLSQKASVAHYLDFFRA